MGHKIKDIRAIEILDSRGNPTIETSIELENGISASASVPSGASKGRYEAVELRDGDPKRFNGQGVLKAVANVNDSLCPLLQNIDSFEQEKIDNMLIEADGTENKSHYGANAILSISKAVAKAAAKSLEIPLYKHLRQLYGNTRGYHRVVPIFNVINGGMHGNSKIPFQEFILTPDISKTYPECLRIGVEIYHSIKKILKLHNCSTCVGDEGGFAPEVDGNTGALDLLKKAVSESGYRIGSDVHISLDIAASTFYSEMKYFPVKEGLNSSKYIDYLVTLKKKYGLFSIEDPLNEDDWNSWKILTEKLGHNTIIIGDDLLVTNKKRLIRAIEHKSCNAILIKPNQIGTISETLDVIRTASENNFKIIISHRSGETTEDFIADLAVAVNADYLKSGAPVRGERVSKYNRLTRIYYELKEQVYI